MKRYISLILLFLLTLICGEISFAQTMTTEKCPLVKIKVNRLPDLHVPRAGHIMLDVNGEMMVASGHTTGFIPTTTAEYFSEGEWHLLQTVYAHDDGLCVKLKSGKVLLGGGHEKHLGIGQTFPVEMYDPTLIPLMVLVAFPKRERWHLAWRLTVAR